MPAVSRDKQRTSRSDREIELKFLLDLATHSKLSTSSQLSKRLRTAKSHKIETTYFDTPDRALHKHDFTLRVRKQDNGRLLTAKHANAISLDRGEWERKVTSDIPAPEDWAGLPIEPILKDRPGAKPLAPAFTTIVDRAAFGITTGVAKIEIAVDHGEVKAADANLPVWELELELKSGRTADLLNYARTLLEQVPLELSFLTKSERGWLLSEGKWATPQQASVAKLSMTMSASDAFKLICQTCLHDIMLNKPAIVESSDIECVHKGRIAVRRLRAAFSLFEPRVSDPGFQPLSAELKWFSDLLGSVRDLDVFSASDYPPGAEALVDEIETRRLAAREALREAMTSRRWRMLLFELLCWLEEGEWQRDQGRKLDKPVMKVAGKLLSKKLAKLRKRSSNLSKLEPTRRHRVRIAAKKLRYMCEFFESLYPSDKPSRRYRKLVDALEAMQKSLGKLRDEEARAEFLDTVTVNPIAKPSPTRSELQAAADALTAKERFSRKKQLKKAEKACAVVRNVKPFWA